MPQQNEGQNIPIQVHTDTSRGAALAVFDGMGGCDYGEAASYAAAQALNAWMQQPRMEADLEQIAQQLNLAVCRAQQSYGSHRMGSTMAMLYLHNQHLHTVNVGDSRIFALRGDSMVLLSRDHTDEAFLKQKGIAGRRPRLTQYLGMDPAEVTLEPYHVHRVLASGDRYLICSDGLTDMLTREQIFEILRSSATAERCAASLIGEALEKGGRDNITVIVCNVLQQSRRDEHAAESDTDSLAQLGTGKASWGRKLWQGLRNTAKAAGWRH